VDINNKFLSNINGNSHTQVNSNNRCNKTRWTWEAPKGDTSASNNQRPCKVTHTKTTPWDRGTTPPEEATLQVACKQEVEQLSAFNLNAEAMQYRLVEQLI
jgi:hypothetical protein